MTQPLPTTDAPPPTAPEAGEAEGVFCAACGYDLRGIAADRCPECGLTIDRARLVRSQVPWAHRQTIGRVRAFARTVRLASFRPAQLAAEVVRPVSYRDAARFRNACVGIVFVAVAVPFLLLHLDVNWAEMIALPQAGPWVIDVGLPWAAGFALWPVAVLSLLLFFAGIAGAGGYWFHPRWLPVVRQNRAVAVAQYAAANLVWLLLPLALLVAAFLAYVSGQDAGAPGWLGTDNDRLVVSLVVLALMLIVVIVVHAWVVVLLLLRQTTHCSAGRIVAAGMGVPASWLLVGCLAFGAFPWVCGFVALVVGSFAGL